MLVAAPILAVCSAAAGFVVANHYDFPPAQLTVTLMCLLLPVGHLAGRLLNPARA